MNQNQDSKPRKPKAFFILSIITSLFIGAMGYEIATKSTVKSQKENAAHKFAILAKQPVASPPEKKQYATLNAQNQHLANKVSSLKEHALELSRRLNLVQLSVFAARRSYDQAKVEEMQAKLQETETVNTQLLVQNASLQKSLNEQEAFAMNMESTIDHLSAMLELQKQSKEKALEGQRSSLELAATAEKTRLLQVIQGLEEHQVKLKDDLEKQSSEIARLEESLAEAKFFAAENESALIFAVQQHDEKQKDLQAQAENLATLLNLEEIAVRSLQNEMNAFEENERLQTLALKEELDRTAMERIHESMIYEDLTRSFANQVIQKQTELDAALANLKEAENQINAQRTDIALLKEQRAERERELIKEHEILLADLALKQENLSLALSKFNSAEVALDEQNQEILSLKDELAKQEVDLAQIRSMASEQLQLNDKLALQMLEKQDELNASLIKYDLADISLIEKQQELIAAREEIAKREQELAEARDIATEKMQANQELLAELAKTREELTNGAMLYAQTEAKLNEQQILLTDLKEQMLQREKELLAANDTMSADLALKEAGLAELTSRLNNSEVHFNAQTEEIAALKEEVAHREQELAQIRDMVALEMKNNQQIAADMALRQQELSIAAVQFSEAEEQIAALKDQMSQREQELVQANEALLSDLAKKEETLSQTIAKSDTFEYELSEKMQEVATLKEQIGLREQELILAHESALVESKRYENLLAEMAGSQEKIVAQTIQLAQQEIAALKEKMSQREQELVQANEALLADIAQKEENLSVALAKFNGSEFHATEQASEIAALKDQLYQREQELVHLQEKNAEEMKNNQQLIAELLQKQEELADTIAQFRNVEAQILAQHQEVLAQKEQMFQREQELMKVNETLLSEMAQKEEALALALVKIESSELSISDQQQAIALLKEQIELREQELAQAHELTQDDLQRQQQLASELTEKQEQLASAVSQLAAAESSIAEQLDAVARLKQRMTDREQELSQVNAALIADIVQKEENLSLALAKFDGSELSLKEQSQAIEHLTARLTDREQELAQVREMALEEAKAQQQLLADMAQKQEELATALALKNHAEISLSQQHQEIVSLKDQMVGIEAAYQEALSAALQKKEEAEVLLKNKIDELQTLNEQLATAKESAASAGLAKTELSNELKNLQQELVAAFGKIEEKDALALTQKQEIEALISQLEETKQTMTAADSQKNVLMEEIINYKNALVNALTDYENEQKRAASLEQQLSTYINKTAEPESTEKAEEDELRSLIDQETFDDQAALEAPLLGLQTLHGVD